MASANVSAIIFDCFGVLVGDGLPVFIQTHFSSDPKKIARAWAYDDKANVDEISETDYLVLLGEMAGLTPQQVKDELSKNTRNQPLLDYIRSELHPQYKTAILSNVYADVLDELIGHENRALFDVEALSYQLKVLKPAPESYQKTAALLGTSPESCIFIDDKEHNCVGARAVHMRAVQYKNFTQCRRDVESLLQ